jgi:hypothetical protein
MVMMIRVIYLDGSTGTVTADELDTLIREKDIVAFCRSGEWARVSSDPLRKRQEPFAGFGQRADDMNVEGV